MLDRPALAVVLVLAGVLIAGLLVSVPLHGGELIVKVSIVEIRLHGVRQPTT